MTALAILKIFLIYGVPSLCLLMFVREFLVSYLFRNKFETSVSESLRMIGDKVTTIENIVNHNISRMTSDISKSTEVDKIVMSARARLKSSRAYLLRFHNGNVFSTTSPVWKFSMCHESTDSSITPISNITKDILVSNVIQLVKPVFSDYSQEQNKIDGIHTINDGKNIFRIDTAEVTVPTFMGFLKLRGIEHMVYAPIHDLDGREVGLFCLDFTNEVPEFLTADYAEREMTEITSMLSTLLS